MQVVIEIDNNLYTRLFDNGVDNYDDAVDMAQAIRKGIPLPKGHGRLIDEKQINECKQVGLIIQDDAVTRCLITDAPTIVEADRVESEE